VLQKQGAAGEAQVAYQRALELDSREPKASKVPRYGRGQQETPPLPPTLVPMSSPSATMSYAA
jgi:hypothetical protein